MRGIRDGIAVKGSFRGGNEFGEETGLAFEIGEGLRGSKSTVDGLEFGSFRFFKEDFRGNEGFVRSRGAGGGFKGSVLIKNSRKSGVEKLEVRFKRYRCGGEKNRGTDVIAKISDVYFTKTAGSFSNALGFRNVGDSDSEKYGTVVRKRWVGGVN